MRFGYVGGRRRRPSTPGRATTVRHRRTVGAGFGRSRRSIRRPAARRGCVGAVAKSLRPGRRRARPPFEHVGGHVARSLPSSRPTASADLRATAAASERPPTGRRRRARRWPGGPCRTAAPSPAACRGRRPSPRGTRRARRRSAVVGGRRPPVRAANASRPASAFDRRVERCRWLIVTGLR